MATLNKKRIPKRTHEGGRASHINAKQELERSVMSCMLWEKEFYEDGVQIADRIACLVKKVKPCDVADIAIRARSEMNLRHVPLLLCRELARTGNLKAETLTNVIQRPDELTEFLAIYWKDGRQPLAAQVKKGLAKAFQKFSEYALAKYNRDGEVKLRDVLFLSHAKPKDQAQGDVFTKLVNNCLETPDTWEVALSGGADKKRTWERLIDSRKLGCLALIRNLRNMQEVGVSVDTIRTGLTEADPSRILPFRFIAAARHAPQFEVELERLMFRSIEEMPKLEGSTVILVDVSASMDSYNSGKSDMVRLDAACGLAMICREVCADTPMGVLVLK